MNYILRIVCFCHVLYFEVVYQKKQKENRIFDF